MAHGRNGIPGARYADQPVKLFKVTRHITRAVDVAFLPDSRLVVADDNQNVVRLFDTRGKSVKTVFSGTKPYGVSTNRNGNIIVTGVRHGKDKTLQMYSADGQFLCRWGEDFTWRPQGVTFNNRGQIIITDLHPHKPCIGIYTIDGRSVNTFAQKGAGKTHLQRPLYVTLDMRDRIIVSDAETHCVKFYDERGTYLGQFGQRGSSPGQLLRPHGVCVDTNGNILVADSGNKRVNLYSSDGRFIETLLSDKENHLGHPLGIAFDRKENLAVAQHKSEGGNLRKLRVYRIYEPRSAIEET